MTRTSDYHITECKQLHRRQSLDHNCSALPSRLLGKKPTGLVFPSESTLLLVAHYHPHITLLLCHVCPPPEELADELNDILASPPPKDAYDHLKGTNLARKTESETSWLRQLLNSEGSCWRNRLLMQTIPFYGYCASIACPKGCVWPSLQLQTHLLTASRRRPTASPNTLHLAC